MFENPLDRISWGPEAPRIEFALQGPIEPARAATSLSEASLVNCESGLRVTRCSGTAVILCERSLVAGVQEAPVAIYSTATSSSDDAPHGMEFLFSRNRLNVATSRARCARILLGNPELFEPECRTPEQMRMANALCRYLGLLVAA